MFYYYLKTATNLVRHIS